MSTLDLTRTAVGDRIQHALLVLERDERRQAGGDPYVVLSLGNASGRLSTAPIWSNQLDWVAGAEKGRIVQVIGDVTAYQKRRQLKLTAPLRILPSDLAQVEAFLPRVAPTAESLWDWIDRGRGEMQSASLRRSVDLFFADDAFRVDFERMPASILGHQAAIGGLLLHVTEVASIARNMARVMKANVELAFAGALLHDVGKVRAYAVTPTGFDQTVPGRLIGHVVLGSLMLQDRLAGVGAEVLSESQRLELHHMILSQRGAPEFGSLVQPMTVEAEILHWANEASARANEVAEGLADDDNFGEGEMGERRHWRMARRIWRRPHQWE